jgi:hypothetical protein
MSTSTVIYRESRAQGGGEQYKGGTDFYNIGTSLLKDLLRVYLEIGRETHHLKTVPRH